jgi:uncharacterized protein (DUF169 family)
VPQIPRLAKTPTTIAYAPLGDAEFTPDTVLFACKPAAVPASLQAGSILSLGCIGNRVYTGLSGDEMYFVVRGKDVAALAAALDTITGANNALKQYAEGRRAELASA